MSQELPLKTKWLGYSDLCWNSFSPRVATISSASNPYHWNGGFITYIGYPKKAEAMTAMKQFLLQQKATDVDLRKASRIKVKGIRWELKIRGLNFGEVVKIASDDLMKNSPN